MGVALPLYADVKYKQCRVKLMYKPIDPVQDGSTVLLVAAQNGHLKVVEMLLAAKCQVDLRNKVSVSASLSIRPSITLKLMCYILTS